MTGTPYSNAVVPAIAVVLFLGIGIVGNPGLGILVDAAGGGGADTGAGTPDEGTPQRTSLDSGDIWSTEDGDPVADESDDRETPANYGERMADVYSEGDTDGSRVGTGDPSLSLLSPESSLRYVLDGPLFPFADHDSSLARTLQATDETVQRVGPDDVGITYGFEAVDDTTDDVDDTTDDSTDTVDDTVDNTTDVVDDTTDDTTDAIENTTDDTTDAVDDTTDDTTDAIENTTDDTTDAVDDTTDDTTDALDDTTDLVNDGSTPTPTPDGGLL